MELLSKLFKFYT